MHYRNSTEVGAAIGKQVGRLAVARHLRSLDKLAPGADESVTTIDITRR